MPSISLASWPPDLQVSLGQGLRTNPHYLLAVSSAVEYGDTKIDAGFAEL